MFWFIIGLILGFAGGIFLLFLLLRFLFFRILFHEEKSPFVFTDTCDALRIEAEKNHWRVLMVHDLQDAILKWGKEVNQIRVYELCNPEIAYTILVLDNERIASSLIPCRIAVYEKKNGKTYMAVLNSGLISFFAPVTVKRAMKSASEEINAIVRQAMGN
jgi:uncharacterized protein (DUF302 family)